MQRGHDTPGSDQRRQKQPWTNLFEEEASRELCSDISPRLMLRLLNQLGRYFRDIHKKDSETDLILVISQMEILLEASNTSVSCNVTLGFYIPRTSNRIFFTDIGAILEDG